MLVYSTAMGTAAIQLDEEALVRDAIGAIEAPAGVRLRRVNLNYVDSTGDLAVQIVFAVSKRLPLTKQRRAGLSKFKRAVAEKITSLGLPKWPFVNYIETR